MKANCYLEEEKKKEFQVHVIFSKREKNVW